MDIGASALARIVIPKVPFLLKTSLWHALSLSDTASKWDLRTALLVNTLREITENPSPGSTVSRAQRGSMGKVESRATSKGAMWISRATAPAPAETGEAAEVVFKAVDEVKETPINYTRPSFVPVEGEWTGYRGGVAKNAVEPTNLSEKDKYDNLMAEVKSPVTILYFHGGAYYLMDPLTHRPTTAKLAKDTQGRVFSVRYRLAPQAAFPSQLMDALVAYLYLLYPPADAFHEAVPASQIVFAGDSAGGNLAVALMQLLLHWQHHNTTFPYAGEQRSVPLPAGVAGNSPWVDITRSLPSLESNAKYDYIPAPSKSRLLKDYPSDAIWPTTPPRGDLFCDVNLLTHPFVSPVIAKEWKGAPPVFMVYGEEMLQDEGAFMAQEMARQGVTVVWEEYESMPHVFAAMLPSSQLGRRCMDSWSSFCRAAVENPSSLTTKGTWIPAKAGADTRTVDVAHLRGEWDRAWVLERMRAVQTQRQTEFEETHKTQASAKL